MAVAPRVVTVKRVMDDEGAGFFLLELISGLVSLFFRSFLTSIRSGMNFCAKSILDDLEAVFG